MQILIDIPEDFYEALKKTDEMSSGLHSEKTLMSVIYSAVAKGTPLPEGHGDLIDKNKLSKKKQYLFKTDNGAFPKSEWFIKADDLFSAEAIIPAHKEIKERCK